MKRSIECSTDSNERASRRELKTRNPTKSPTPRSTSRWEDAGIQLDPTGWIVYSEGMIEMSNPGNYNRGDLEAVEMRWRWTGEGKSVTETSSTNDIERVLLLEGV